MIGRRQAHASEPDRRERSLRSSVPLLVAALLFGLGAVGLHSVLPYSGGPGDDARLVTSPSQAPGDDASGARVSDASLGGSLSGETIPDSPSLAPAAEPSEVPAVVFAVAVPDQAVAGLTPLPDPPTLTPTPPASATPTPVASSNEPTAPKASPTPRYSFIPDSREPGPIKPIEPVTAFMDPSFQQPAPESPIGGGSGSQFPVTP